MQQHLQEFVDSQGQQLRADAEQGVLRGVKLLGLTSRNGRTYREAALADAVPLYEGAKVNVNHAKSGPLTPRDYQDRLGAIRNVHFRQGEGLFADLAFNPKHPLAEQLAWDAEHAPEQVGLSHNVLARTTRDGTVTVVEAITKVDSVDLVADPATTRGLFEHAEPSQLEEQLASARAATARLERKVRVYELLAEHGLPLPGSGDPSDRQVVSEAFFNLLADAESDEVLESLIADRAQLVRESAGRAQPTVAREQRWVDDRRSGPVSAQEFAAALRR